MDSSKNRDKAKLEKCKELGKKYMKKYIIQFPGITLIEIPYWWDRKLPSLAVTIYNSRPDLFDIKPQGTAIPLTPPTEAESRPHKEFLMTATEWDNETMEPKGWYMTEKYDGMRLFWTGKEFISRQGNRVKAPESITKQLPSVSLDGEIW